LRFCSIIFAASLAGLAACGTDPSSSTALTEVSGPALQLSDVLGTKLLLYAAHNPRTATWPASLVDADQDMVQGLLITLAGSNKRYAKLAQQDMDSLGLAGLRPLLTCLQLAQEKLGDTATERWLIARTLGSIPHASAMLALLELAKTDPDSKVRSMAIYQLGESPLNGDWTVPHLCLRLKYETDAECHRLLGQVLAKHQNYSFLPAWFELTRSPDPEVSTPIWAALRHLESQSGSTGEQMAADWNAATGSPQPAPSDALLHEVWFFVSGLSGQHFQLRGVDDARFALSDLGPWLAEELAPALKDSDLYVRLHVAQVLQRLAARGKAAVPALIEALQDPDLGPQAAATLATLSTLEERSALQPLLQAASSTSALDLRTAAVRALGETAWPEGASVLRSAMADGAVPGQADLGVHARCALLQVAPTAEVLDDLLELLMNQETGQAAAELAFEASLRRKAAAAQPEDPAAQDWRAWVQMGSSFGARPSAEGLAKRRSSRAQWIEQNRERLQMYGAATRASR
jgi:HEAT repeat protein